MALHIKSGEKRESFQWMDALIKDTDQTAQGGRVIFFCSNIWSQNLTPKLDTNQIKKHHKSAQNKREKR